MFEMGDYCKVIVDGGMCMGGDVVKVIVCGVDVVMIGLLFVCVYEVFGYGFYWGMVMFYFLFLWGVCVCMM